PPLRCGPWDLATARLVPPLPGGNGLLGFGWFLNAVVNRDRDDNENPHGKDSHPGNRFGNQARQQNPSPAQKQEQEESGSQIERPLQRRGKFGPYREEVRNRGHRKSNGQSCTGVAPQRHDWFLRSENNWLVSLHPGARSLIGSCHDRAGSASSAFCSNDWAQGCGLLVLRPRETV